MPPAAFPETTVRSMKIAMESSRRDILSQFGKYILLTPAAAAGLKMLQGVASAASEAYKRADHWWGMTIDIAKCIGCGNCVRACARENDVPEGHFRTWVERYTIENDRDHPRVESPHGGISGFPAENRPGVKSFFVPK